MVKHAEEYGGSLEVVFLVPYSVLALAVTLAQGSGFKIGSQNHFWEDFGPYTGEVSAAMVKDCGAEYALVGHYERRRHFHETVTEIHLKARAALRNRLIPIICIGESIEEHRSGNGRTAMKGQMDIIFKDFNPTEMADCCILYEPFWAVGAEEPAPSGEAQNAHHLIREEIRKGFGEAVSKKVRVLYGGSVRPDHVAEFLTRKDVDGIGVGRAGLEADSFLRVLEAACLDRT